MTREEAPGARDIAVVAFAQTDHRRTSEELSEVEMLMPVLHEVMARTGLRTADIGFTCSGSSDYLAGRAFSFTLALDGVGAWPPISESHVEMDGAWALYEAWVKLSTGDVDTALVYSYGKSSPGSVRDVLTRQLDPYYLAPLWPDSVALAALQAQALIDTGATDEPALAAIGARSRADAAGNPHAQLRGSVPQGDYLVRPLRTGDCPPIGDGAAAVVLAAGERAQELCERPAWIRGIDHRVEAHGIGVRDLTDSPSTRIAAERAGVFERPVDSAELHAPFSSQEVILRKVLGLDETVRVNPSGGAQAANPIMAAGLIRIGEAAARIHRGESDRALAHATSGPCLQQNLVAVLEGDPR
ncbi:thiolase domain-containing protein [Streptomyces caniscabiei]|uniref:Thiolase domain-containing protein n=1 Tax=Streptomyces caniscabiei TaxID=2746961 RepID=A0ABU4MVT2_9ACTN|nr:thiolase domain-containing protein [Streptomyces caniscabiei]MBE4737550.1 thiolase domain-containing protein [Streptomyces caniscabiei]MBE4756310.1 thiolase domain-containing protein [Streptomyces caniscabiei]MBE4769673.1 thiolase domain-containing protein [Streptomyces caniscabiei]MBE4787381.1 thiolase domain-containing protein [Streptomyces caniscabiei]MBE4795214.1 thiolase domain-containing protein [Streptomyces caniscabiei]